MAQDIRSKAPPVEQKKKGRGRNKGGADGAAKNQFLEDYRKMEKDKENPNSLRFKPLDTEDELPYHTLELIFNNRNVWANCQFHDPARIRFDVWDE